MSGNGFISKIDKSAVYTVIGILCLFATSIAMTLLAPRYIDSSWTTPSSEYQIQTYEVADPNIYISTAGSATDALISVHHLQQGFSLLAFSESNVLRIVAPDHLQKYITKFDEKVLRLSSDMLMLREPRVPDTLNAFDAPSASSKMQQELQLQWVLDNPRWENEAKQMPYYTILELYEPNKPEAFSIIETSNVIEDWVDTDFKVIDIGNRQPYHKSSGVVYVNNPKEYRVKKYTFGHLEEWRYNPEGNPIASLDELKGSELGFLSRKELIELGETVFVADGCWYCHTDQTRTLIQDTVLNGSESYPAPPTTANEYVYQRVSFLGTRRIGPDLSRVGVKRASRDWHKAHFWSPKTQSAGSIMPSFRYFFDDDPRGTSKNPYGVPNYRFEAVFQYLMTKGTRITAPTQAWWLGKDPVRTKDLIEGRKS